MVRLTLTRFLLLLSILLLLIIFWNMLLNSQSHENDFKNTCNMSEAYLKSLENLMDRVHIILDQYSLLHTLCYGSLWGQIRISKLFPWSEKAQFCVLNKELELIDESNFMKMFEKNDLKITYSSFEGIYHVEDSLTKGPPIVEIYLFGHDKQQNMYKRVGWKHRLLPQDCDYTKSLDCFPANLIQTPLPKKSLGSHFYSVPMGGVEIQKYHYADNWWKEVTTKNCNIK